jgi:mannan endo-1,4-beta-mannosidase
MLTHQVRTVRWLLLWLLVVSAAPLATAQSSGDTSAAIDAPVSPNSLPEVGQLLNFLRNTRGKFVLSGQQEFPGWPDTIAIGEASDPDFARILTVTGKMPAVRGFDFLFYTHSAAGRATQRSTDRAIAWWRRGGIVTFCCHLFMDAGSPIGNPQFYVPSSNNGVGTTIDLNRVVVAGTSENTEFNAKLDLIAVELKRLRDARVPVLWRPFHECSGGWFWWGAKGPAPFIAAYRYMFDRFTSLHGLTNLIWVYNPTETGTNLETWYPGDAFVDLISFDFYPTTGTHPTRAADYRRAVAFKSGRKLVAMSENGAIPDPDQLVADQAWWSYFCTWNGNFIRDGIVNPTALLQRVFNHPRVLTLDEMPAFFPRPDQPPKITVSPVDAATTAGSTLTLGVVADGSAPLTYQWRRNGSDVSGATEAALRFPAIKPSDAASYDVIVRNANGSTTSASATLKVEGPASPPPTTLTNLSTRGLVAGGNESLIVGFVIGGSGTKRVLVRAVGPTLSGAPFNLGGTLADPYLTLTRADGSLVRRNDDWDYTGSRDALRAGFSATGAFDLPNDSRDAATIVDLPTGNYTAIVHGADGRPGTAIVELYDLEPGSAAYLAHLSTRASVGTGNNVLIVGYGVRGAGRLQLLTRAVGPTLGLFGLTGLLADPQLELTLTDGTVLLSNDHWEQFAGNTGSIVIPPVAARVGAFALPAASKDAALLTTQGAGNRTVIIRGAGGSTGLALAEIFTDPEPGR